jgi:hypothetical protein
MLMISVSENSLVESEWFFFFQNKIGSLARSFNFTFRYTDDVLSLNNSRFGDFVDRIYPIELEIKVTQIFHNGHPSHDGDRKFYQKEPLVQ